MHGHLRSGNLKSEVIRSVGPAARRGRSRAGSSGVQTRGGSGGRREAQYEDRLGAESGVDGREWDPARGQEAGCEC